MRIVRVSSVLPFIAGLALIWWASQPPNSIVVSRSCEISGFRNQLSEMVYGRRFWEDQLQQMRVLRTEITRISAAEDAAGENRPNSVSRIERRMSTLSSGGSSGGVRSEWAGQEERTRRLETIGWLTLCEGQIAERIGSQ